MGIQNSKITKTADALYKRYKTRDPFELAEDLNIRVMQRNFSEQKGAYKVILGNRFIFIKQDLPDVMKKIVMLHEIGHDQLHRRAAVESHGFQEFNIFNMQNSRMEYEANIFAAQYSLPDEEVLNYILQGYDITQIASLMNSDINLVALKDDALIAKGYLLHRMDHQSDFLK